MADIGVQRERDAQARVSDDDDEEVALVTAAVLPATDEDTPAREVDPVLSSSTKSEAQVNGVMVLALLDKIIGVVDQIQHTQSGLEARQQDMEKSVTGIHGELAKLSKSHTSTASSVNKMLEKVRKVSVNVKTVRTNLEKQQGQIKRLERNEDELLKRRNFKVLIYQDQVKAVKPSKSVKAKEKTVEGAEEEGELEVREVPEEGEVAHTGLSSDEEVEIEETIEESRAERIKRTSKQRVDNIKKAFSKEKMEKTKLKTKENLEKTRQRTRENLEKTRQRTRENLEKTKQSLEKKMGKLSTRMAINPERKEKIRSSREKMKKSLTPDHTEHARSKNTVYRVPPFTFHVKKVREGEVEEPQSADTGKGSEDEALQGGEEPEEEEEEEEDGDLSLEMEEGELVNVDSPEMATLLEVTENSDVVLVPRERPRERTTK